MIPCKRLNNFISAIDGALTGTITPSQSGPGSNGTEGVFHTPQTLGMELHHQV